VNKAPFKQGPPVLESRLRWRSFFLWLLGGLLFALAACASLPTPVARLQAAEQLAATAGWQRLDIAAPPFVLSAWLPARPDNNADHHEPLTIYLEGDGLAWRSPTSISADPTPINPLALRLALRHPGGQAAYLARPCQYRELKNSPDCDEKYWTSHRFAPEVIEASNVAISKLRALIPADSLRLVGYSGGGAVAALVAARRHDVAQLITVAGNLDQAAWTKAHRLTPLTGSLNPADYPDELSKVPQTHLVGGKDRIVGEYVARSFQARFPTDRRPDLELFPAYDHRCCWAENWPEIFGSVIAKTTARKEEAEAKAQP